MRRDYRLHQLEDTEFEDLVVKICIKWLGEGVIPFATGKDGGRDGKFTGTATCFPSEREPLKGQFILQAKHTGNPVGSCSDREFDRVLDKEEPRIRALVQAGKVDHYLLFTNRSVTAQAEDKNVGRVLGYGVQTSYLIGRETIHSRLDLWRDVLRSLDLPLYETPFVFDPRDLTQVIVEFHDTITNTSAFDSATDFTYLRKDAKNSINGLSPRYYHFIESDSLPFFTDIKSFLGNPRNTELAALYHDAANDLKQKIIVHRNRFDTFDEVLTHLYDETIRENAALKAKRRYLTVFLHYMYFDCDIGDHD